MQKEMTISGAAKGLLAAIVYYIGTTVWWNVILRIVWFVAVIAFLSAVFSSFAESERRAGVLYGVIFLILIAFGIWRFSRKPAAKS